MTKRISPNAIIALKKALSCIFWTKNDCRNFIEYSIENKEIVSRINWEGNTKYESVSKIIDYMVRNENRYQNDLINLCYHASNMKNFTHFEKWQDSETKIKNAKRAVETLREATKGYFDVIKEKEDRQKYKEEYIEQLSQTEDYKRKLNKFKELFEQLVKEENAQKRGYEFEKFLNDLFIFFDLSPKASFKIVGEQIDGAFTFDNTDYLLEAKWQKSLIEASDLYSFGGKIEGKLKNTLGLFISFNGFSNTALETKSPILRSIILMDGLDLTSVLDNKITLNDLLFQKRRHAAETGEILYRVFK